MAVHAQHPHSTTDSDAADLAVPAYPSLRAAAKLIGIHPSTLSRRPGLRRVSAGQETRIPAAEVLRLAAEYKQRRLSRVAGELVERAAPAGEEAQRAVAAEVDAELARVSPKRSDDAAVAQFLSEAKQRLPKALVAQIERSLAEPAEDNGSSVGWSPDGD